MNVCSFCLQPGNVFPTGVPSQFTCAKCQPYTNHGSNNGPYPHVQPQVTVGDETQGHSRSTDGLFYCTICNKSFEKNLQYQNHVRNHRAERKFVCPHCHKGFSQSNNLRAHLRIHTNERPFKCPECGKAFTQVTNLNNHIRLHTGEKPFVCKEPGCNRAFAQVTNLNNHKKSHMRDFKTFKCNYCSKSFAQRNHLVAHVQAEHEAQICNACGEAFPSSAALIDHIRRECVERAKQAEKRRIEINDDSFKKKGSSSGSVKCLFGDCQMFFESMSLLQGHLSSKHGLAINNRSNKIINKDPSEIIEIGDEDSPTKSTTSTRRYYQSDQAISRMGALPATEKDSTSESDDDSSDDGDSDSRQTERRKETAPQQIKMVCNICFSMFDSSKQLERHIRRSH